MNKKFYFCDALKFKTEAKGMCCANGKTKLPILHHPPEPLPSSLSGDTADSKHLLQNGRKYNSAFQMSSFGADKIFNDGYMMTFKIQGQLYHRVGSLLPIPDADYKFLQIYFVGDEDAQVDRRCNNIPGTRRHIISELQKFFYQHDELIRLFEASIDYLPADNYGIRIRTDKTPR